MQAKSLSLNFTKRDFMDLAQITLGLAMFACSFSLFILPQGVVTAGVTGLATTIFFAFGIKISWTYFFVNLVLLFVGLRFLGFKVMAKTIYAIFTLSLFLDIAQDLVTLEDGSIYQLFESKDILFSLLLGCIFNGIALALCFMANGTTGGMDIIAASINKYHNVSIGRVLLVVDFCVICTSYPVFHDPAKIIYGVATVVAENWVLDYWMNAQRQSVQFLIFSQKYEELAKSIATEFRHGVTILDGHGWYTGNEMKVLCIIARKREQIGILRLIKQMDPKAFVSVGQVSGVYGEGFDQIKK